MFDIRTASVDFRLVIKEDTKLPKNKSSALRGGMGQSLLELNCIKDMNCKNCGFVQECVVRNIMYSKFKTKPYFVSQEESVGYIIECFDEREIFNIGDVLSFRLILFGSTIAYFHQIFYAFSFLGVKGLGKENSKFSIESISNRKGRLIFNGERITIKNLLIETVQDYIFDRLENVTEINEVCFLSPCRIKIQGKYVNNLNFEIFLKAISRRLMILNAFEGNEIEEIRISTNPKILFEDFRWIDIERYSTTQKAALKFGGIKGTVKFSYEINDYLPYVIACELLHIGKNTSFGFGKFLVK